MRLLVVALSIIGSSSVPQISSTEERDDLLAQPKKICCNVDPEESMEANEEVCLSSTVSGLKSFLKKNGRACCSFVDDIQTTTSKPTTTTKTTLPAPLLQMPCEGVLVIGGDSWSGRLSSVEVLGFTLTSIPSQVLGPSTVDFPDLPTPRWGHLAFHLPGSDQFLVCGGKGNHHDPRFSFHHSTLSTPPLLPLTPGTFRPASTSTTSSPTGRSTASSSSRGTSPPT